MQSNISNDLKTSLGPYNLSSDFISTSSDSDKMGYYLGDGWCTFPDLDNFDSEKLLRALTLKEKDSGESIWDPSLSHTESLQRKTSQALNVSVSALRQLEALFNLTQLLFGLSRAETVNYTFRDLQLRKHPHSFKKSGFKQLNTDGRIDFYAIFESLVKNIIEQGGLEVALLMYRNPVLPMVRQKCLDLISNVATVPDVAHKIMLYQSWFLDHLLIMIRDGDIVSDKIPALSVLIRLLKVMLTERMVASYMKLVDMQYIDCLVDIFENPKYTDSSEFLPFFIKFEFITMQSLTVILGDIEYSQFWSDKAKTRLLNYCMIVLLKAAGAYPAGGVQANQSTYSTITNCNNIINHILYAEQHTNKHSLAHTIMTVTELLRNDDNMKLFYRYHKPFKQLIIQLYKKYGAKSQFSRIDPGISYALNHLMRVLYIKNPNSQNVISSSCSSSSNQLCISNGENQPARVCSNPICKNEETKYKEFKVCPGCEGKLAAYCSRKCRKAHLNYHRKNECFKQQQQQQQQQQQAQYVQERSLKKKLSLNLNNDGYSMQTGDSVHQSLSRTKRLSKYSSMNENHRRNSLNFVRSGSGTASNFQTANFPLKKPPLTHYTKHTSSMKEIKSTRTYEESSIRLKIGSKSQNEASINFVRPLKTSTALCLTDLTRKQQSKQISSISNSTSSSSSSTETSHQPTSKKFKTTNGSKNISQKTASLDESNENSKSHKRRHSTAAPATTAPKFESTNQKYFYQKQEFENISYENGESDEDDDLDDFLSTSSSSSSSSSSTSLSILSNDQNEDNTIEKSSDQDEEVEGERWATRNDLRTRGSNHRVESPESSEIFASMNEISNTSVTETGVQDELERKSQFKVIKEFEKTLEFVKNASNLKIMYLKPDFQQESGNDTLKKSNRDSNSLKAPHISLSSLCYDRNNSTNPQNHQNTDDEDNSSDEDEDNHKFVTNKKPFTNYSQPKGVNLIINNSIDSQMISNSFNTKSETLASKQNDFIDDEMSMFKNETLNSNKTSDYKTFKIPLLPPPTSQHTNLPLSLQPIQIQPNEYLLKNNKIYNELKVFNNISNFENSVNTSGQTELPKNSTPILTDNTTAAYLTAKRKQLLNAKLDLTITGTQEQKQPQQIVKPIERKPSNHQFSTPKSNSKEQVYVTSTLKSNNNLANKLVPNPKLLGVPLVETKITGSLDLSKLSAIENVVTSTNLICVTKAEIPKDIKKCLKDEIKKDKTKCVIQ